ncbi:MAG: benzoate/H(+) symporter BenE family transporter [Agromyces sp.]
MSSAELRSGRASISQPIVAGIVAVMTGFASAFTIVLAGLTAVGANREQASSGLLAVCLVAGVASVIVPWRLKRPVSFSWSTPGAAALIAAGVPGGGFSAAVGAFIVAGALTLLAGLWLPFERAIVAIPRPIAGGMLAGILLPICLAPAKAATLYPWVIIPMVIVWLILLRVAARWAVAAAMLVAVIGIVAMAGTRAFEGADLAPHLDFVLPTFNIAAIVGIGVPLFIVTMAGQNIPGFAVLNTFGYPQTVRPALQISGVGSILGAFAGGHAVNLAALSAAMMAGPEGGPDRSRRWIASSVNGAGYIVFGLLTGIISAVVAVAPPELITAAAGLGMFSAFISATVSAFEDAAMRLPAAVTIVVTVSGMTIAGVGSALWGLLAGLVVAAALTRRSRETS